MKTLKLADSLSLPLEIASQCTCIFGLRGGGKTNTAGVIVEELMDHHQAVCIIDPTDAWYGLRTAKDGKTAGYPIFIFGGQHGDIPLTENDGKTIAEFIVKENVSVVLSLRHLRKNAQRRFVTEFCEEIYHLKGKDEHKTPLTVVIDEAPLFVPQKVLGEVARTVGAVEDLIARGRNAGFGVILISQRSATVNSDVRTQADTIICHRLTSPLDRKALIEWFEANATVENLKAVLATLATLKNGQGWVWSPLLNIMEKTQIRLRRTFDSSRTPTMGERREPPKKLAEVDLEKLKGRLAQAVEQRKAEDPKELRKQLTDAQRRITELESRPAATAQKPVEVPVLNSIQIAALQSSFTQVSQSFERCVASLEQNVRQHLEPIAKVLLDAAGKLKAAPVPAKPANIIPELSRPQLEPRQASIREPRESAAGLDGTAQRALNTIAMLEYRQIDATPESVARWMGIHPRGGRYTSGLAKLRAVGYLDGWTLTDAGRQAVTENYETGIPAVLEAIKDGTARRSFEAVLAAQSALSVDELAGALGIHPRGGRFTSGLAWLRQMGVITERAPIAVTEGARR